MERALNLVAKNEKRRNVGSMKGERACKTIRHGFSKLAEKEAKSIVVNVLTKFACSHVIVFFSDTRAYEKEV